MVFHSCPSRAQSRYRRIRPSVEILENRSLLNGNPLNEHFQEQFNSLLESFRVPQGSLAVDHEGKIYTAGYNGHGFQPQVTEDTVFRVGSVSKVVTAAAIMKLIHDGATVTVGGQSQTFSLDDSAFLDLGFTPGQTISGFTFNNGQPLAVDLPVSPLIFDISVRELLQMTSGFQDNFSLASAAFPTAGGGDVMYLEGNYAALLFSRGNNPGTTAATVEELINYVVTRDFHTVPAGSKCELCQNALYPPGTTYDYNNFGYLVLGALAEKIAHEFYSSANYEEFVQAKLFDAFEIDTMKLGKTLQSEALNNEALYYPTDFQQLYNYSVFPDPTNIHHLDALYRGLPAPGPYGGDFYLETHYGNGAWVASPSDLVKFYSGLNAIYTGHDGPLSKKDLEMMVAAPVVPGTGEKPVGGAPGAEVELPDFETRFGYFGLGWNVEPSLTAGRETWHKDGSLGSNLAYVERFPDGTVFAYTLNTTPADQANIQTQLRALISRTLFPQEPTLVPMTAASPHHQPVQLHVLAGAHPGHAGSVMMPDWIEINTPPRHGKVELDKNTGVITYTPEPGFNGVDHFIYYARNDLFVASPLMTAVIHVGTPPRPPEPPVEVFALGTGKGSKPQVRVFDAATGKLLFRFRAYSRGFAGGVRVALADLNGDKVRDIITAPGPGAGPHVKVFDGRTGERLGTFLAFNPTFRAGLSLAVGDLNRDGVDDIIVGAGSGGHVKVFDGRTFNQLLSSQAFPRTFEDSVIVAVSEIIGDGTPNIIARSQRGRRFKVFNGRTGELIAGFTTTLPEDLGGLGSD